MVDQHSDHDAYRECAYSDALTLVAMGETYGWAADVIGKYPLTPDEKREILAAALKDALAQGVEREDIDGSWFA